MQLPDKTIRVLLVDDHQTMLWGLEKLIDAEQPRMGVVSTARDGAEAIAKAAELAPDVILLDLDLCGQSSLDILPELQLKSPSSRVLILTAEREQKTLDQAVLQGARGVLGKDASADEVLKAIEKAHQGELCLDQQALGRIFSKFMEPKRTPQQDYEAQKLASLTPRERKVIETIVKESGASNTTLAQCLCVAEHTLRNHLTSIYHKLGVANRLELYIFAVKHRFEQAH